jgi:DNA-binding transcriptional regulator LsrR (DeoR family)
MDTRLTDTPRIHRPELLSEVAELYYVHDWTQARLARHTGLSQSQISRMVKEARERGIVEIRVHHPRRTSSALQDRLTQLLGLEHCRVLANDTMTDEPNNGNESVSQRVGALAAQFLQEHVADRNTIGLGWGNMVFHTVTAGYLTNKRGVTVAQIQGGVGGPSQDVDGARLAGILGQHLRATTHYLNAPMIVADPAVRTGLMRDPHIRRTFDIGRIADVSIVGIGAISTQSGLYRAGYLTDDDLAHIASEGAVGDVCGRFFKQDGAPCALELDDRIVALRRDVLLEIPLRVGVSSGIAKAHCNIGAARSRMINVLITDENAALEMIDLIESRHGDATS